jgi:hypothetical protein
MTTNSELLTMANKLGLENFRGVFMADELKGLTQEAIECGIVNFMMSSERVRIGLRGLRKGTKSTSLIAMEQIFYHG